MRRSRSLSAGVALAFLTIAVAAVVPSIASAGAAAGPTASVSTANGLLDGQFITVSWSGFPHSAPPDDLEAVSVAECKAAPVSANSNCAPSVAGVSDANGAGVASLQIHTGTVLAANAVSSFTCDHTTPCTITVFVNPSVPITRPTAAAPAATTPIAFGFPADDCPHGNTGINGTGAEAVNRAMLAWEASVCQPPDSLDLQYTRTESEDGKAAFIGRPGITKPDFAVTSVPFSATDLASLKSQKRTFAYAPVAASGLVFVFHGTDRVTGQPLTHLTLTPSELAHIFNGTRDSMPTAASDQESKDILALNPGTNFWPNLLAFGRLDTAAGTLEATSFFLANAPTAWKDIPQYVDTRPSRDGGPSEAVDYATPTENMPDGLEGPGATNQLVDGPDILASTLDGQGQTIGNDPATLNLGYLDSSTAAFYGLPTVCIQMDPNWRTTHTPCVNATPASIAAALAVAKRNPDGTVTPTFNPSNRAAYPMLDVSYLVAPTNLGPTPAAKTLQQLIEFAVAHGPDSGVLPAGYADLPADLAKDALTTASAVTNKPPAPPTTTPPTTTPTTTPTTEPVTSLGGVSGNFGGGGSFDESTPTTVPTTTPATNAKATTGAKPKPKPATPASIAKTAFAKAGAQLSGHASWAVLVALTLFCGLGLIFRPVREVPWIAKRIASLRALPLPWRRSSPGVAP